jgi:NAD+ kinase
MITPPQKIHFHVNESKCESADVRNMLVSLFDAHGIVEEKDGSLADMVVVIGGDGTILRAVRKHPDKSVIGFNMGTLGYLSSVERSNFEKAVEMIAAGRFSLSRRTMLVVSKAGEKRVSALNDIVLMRECSGHAAILDLAVDGKSASRYLADGLVFATPTGSTAYSLSAGGPVLMPDSASFVVTPMNPHALGIRPMVVSDSVVMTVTVKGRCDLQDGKIGVYADGGNVFSLGPGEKVEISRSSLNALIVTLEGFDPYEVLSRKLGWRGTAFSKSEEESFE